MNNKLEGFVKDNKKAFEVKGPSDQLWQRISAELDKEQQPKKKIELYKWLSIAAMLVISLGIYFTYNYRMANKTIDVADVNPAFGKKEMRFASLIEEKRDSLEIYAKRNPDLYRKFIDDMNKLDNDYEQLKKQLQTSPNPEVIVRAMMKNLEIQSSVLSQQLSIINQVNQYKKENTI
ncbi:hypothetical protein ACHMWN_05430 [Pedobacter sp. UC225_61]|uniref:hypothetical protein n=1 Tax=Pedobacter sp. UC225_61 TaxID=3374623 RepID=UPI0037A662B2